MLVLSRKVGETVVLPTRGVAVTVVATRGKRVRLGIVAPPEVQVHRSEVLGTRDKVNPSSGAGAAMQGGRSTGKPGSSED
jgi:carbon storage regulator